MMMHGIGMCSVRTNGHRVWDVLTTILDGDDEIILSVHIQPIRSRTNRAANSSELHKVMLHNKMIHRWTLDSGAHTTHTHRSLSSIREKVYAWNVKFVRSRRISLCSSRVYSYSFFSVFVHRRSRFSLFCTHLVVFVFAVSIKSNQLILFHCVKNGWIHNWIVSMAIEQCSIFFIIMVSCVPMSFHKIHYIFFFFFNFVVCIVFDIGFCVIHSPSCRSKHDNRDTWHKQNNTNCLRRKINNK